VEPSIFESVHLMQSSLTKPDVTGLVATPEQEPLEQGMRRSVILSRLEDLVSWGRIDARKIVQRHRGWISDERVRDIAEHLGIAATDVNSIAMFYNLIPRKPVGRHVVMVCDSASCWIMGYDRMKKHLSEGLGIEYGVTTSDDRFAMLPIVCLGYCDDAPAMMVDSDLHSNLNPQKIDSALEKYK
jgi:NADH-quinone oxidoreductase subunit E